MSVLVSVLITAGYAFPFSPVQFSRRCCSVLAVLPTWTGGPRDTVVLGQLDKVYCASIRCCAITVPEATADTLLVLLVRAGRTRDLLMKRGFDECVYGLSARSISLFGPVECKHLIMLFRLANFGE